MDSKSDLKLEIKHRYGLARTGAMTGSGVNLNLPIIAGIDHYTSDCQTEFDMLINERLDELTYAIISNKLPTIKKPNLKQSVLYLTYEPNPLISKNMDLLPNDYNREHSQYSLTIPGTIQFPECLFEVSITPGTVFSADRDEMHGTPDLLEVEVITEPQNAPRAGSGILILNNSLRLLDNPRYLLRKLFLLGHRTMPNKLLYLPGVATANNIAILVYLGADILDISQCILHARAENFMTNTGPIPASVAEPGICFCSGCSKLKDLKNVGKIGKNSTDRHDQDERFLAILDHNITALKTELALVKTALACGNFRSLIEQRMVSDPKLTELVRIMDLEYYDHLEKYFPIYTSHQFLTNSRESLNRIEIQRFRQRVILHYKKPEYGRVLLLLPCSAKKPYSTSKSHKLFRTAIDNAIQIALKNTTQDSIRSPGLKKLRALITEMIITSPLGVVPREFELIYPAQQYDIPVTGHWFDDELRMIKDMFSKLIQKNQFDKIIIHLDPILTQAIIETLKDLSETKYIRPEYISPENNVKFKLPEIIQTCKRTPTNSESLENLTEQLGKILSDYASQKHVQAIEELNKKYEIMEENIELLRNIARYQFGEFGEELIKGSKIKGRYPNLRIFKDNKQLGMLTADRGLISLTLAGAKVLKELPKFDYLIEIDDFVPMGSIMSVGIKNASSKILAGDEVVACYKHQVRAVGQAVMSGSEMEAYNYGVAVKVRHHI